MPLSLQTSARILIIEDNEVDACLLRETLDEVGSHGLEITLAGSVLEALTFSRKKDLM